MTHALSSAGTYFVASSVGGGPSRTSVTMIPWVSGDGYVYCPPDTCCVGSSATSRTEIVEAFQDGGIGMKSTFFHAKLPSSFTKDIQLFRRTDSSTAGPAENVSEGTVEWHRLSLAGNNACSYTEPSEVWAVKNKLGYFSVTPRRWSVPTTGPVTTKVLELAGELKGATSADGGGALESVDYTYAYGPREDKHLETSSRVSLIQNGGVATTTYKYDLSTSRLTAVVESGWTQNFDAGVPEQKHRATFYKLLRECDFDGTADSYGRALRIEGPCFVDSPTATGCSGEFPVTEFTYFSATTTGANRAGRLRLVKRYP
ncbi:MAG: hypothetical protein Q8M65_04205, partial [Rhodoglobus sp.]|nr:hypothetical protein [Rhodoglobus sp.]